PLSRAAGLPGLQRRGGDVTMKPKRKRPEPSALPSPWYTISDMMRLFSCSDKTVWKWTATGQLPAPVRKGRRWTRWPRETVDALLARMIAGGGRKDGNHALLP